MNKIKYKNVVNKLMFLGTIIVFQVMIGCIYESPALFNDSYSYLEFSFSDFWSGRTFVYPLLIKIAQLIGREKYLSILVLMQTVVSYMSFYFLYKIMLEIGCNANISKVITMIYASSPCVFLWNKCIMTESLALSLCIVYIFLILEFVRTSSCWSAMKIAVVLLVMVYLRPAFLVFLYATFLFFGFFTIIKKGRKNIWPIIILSGVIVVTVVYSYFFYLHNGIFSISDPMPRQMMVVCIDREYYHDSNNKTYKEFIEQNIENANDSWDIVLPYIEEYGLRNAYVSSVECIKANWKKYILDEIKISIEDGIKPFYGYNISKNKNDMYQLVALLISSMLPVFPLECLGLAVFLILKVLKHIKTRIDLLSLGCGLYIVGIYLFTMIATCAEYKRTMIYLIPFFYIIFTYAFFGEEKENAKYWVIEIER